MTDSVVPAVEMRGNPSLFMSRSLISPTQIGGLYQTRSANVPSPLLSKMNIWPLVATRSISPSLST